MTRISASCCFCHRDASENIYKQLYNTIFRIAEQDCKNVFIGGMCEFERIFSTAV